jgi:CRISPR-associated protein Cas8a1/Csx13
MARSPRASGGSLTCDLFSPGMTSIHRVGLAGLWMTVDSLQKQGWKATDSGSTITASDTFVRFEWRGDGEAFFAEFLKAAFQIHVTGLFHFPGIGDPLDHPGHAVILQDAILGTVLQHGQTRKAEAAKEGTGAVTVEIDDQPEILSFRRLSCYAHQNSGFNPSNSTRLAGWQYPGGVERHVAHGQVTKLEEPPERALPLLFLPVGAIFFQINRRSAGIRPQYAMVIPELMNLRGYARARRHLLRFGVSQLQAGGTGVAALRVMTELRAAGVMPDLGCTGCRVLAFGTVPWGKQQKTRLEVFDVGETAPAVFEIFRFCENVLPARYVRREGKPSFWAVPQVPGLVARNLIRSLPWWSGFADFVADADTREAVYGFEKGGLHQMVTDEATLPDSPERVFVGACHEAWRRRMAQIGDKARRENSNFTKQVQREFIRLRSAFSRSKNAVAIREVVTDFWVRGGPNSVLQDRWADVLKLFTPENWKSARDLALLALASYKAATPVEQAALEAAAETDKFTGEIE